MMALQGRNRQGDVFKGGPQLSMQIKWMETIINSYSYHEGKTMDLQRIDVMTVHTLQHVWLSFTIPAFRQPPSSSCRRTHEVCRAPWGEQHLNMKKEVVCTSSLFQQSPVCFFHTAGASAHKHSPFSPPQEACHYIQFQSQLEIIWMLARN